MLGAVLVLVLAQTHWTASATVEPRRETLRYRFDNPSSFDTVELVPHFFEQTYDTDNFWVGGRITGPLFGVEARLHAAMTPQVTARADDFDTFFQPDGNVIVTGTTGNASLRAWTAGTRVVAGRTRTLEYGLGYAHRRDSARYHEGLRILTMTQPALEIRELVTTREFVTSQIHRIDVFTTWTPDAPAGFSGAVTVAPVARGRLQVELPDKYPGREIVFDALGSIVDLEGTFTASAGGFAVGGGLRVSRAFSWRRTAQMHLSSVSLLFLIGTR